MPTLEDIARQTLGACNSDAGYPLVAQWVLARYEQLATRVKLKSRRRLGEVVMPAALTTGTITATRGSQVLTGNAAATAAWGPFLIGRYVRTKVVWYEIVGYQVVGGTGTITIQNQYQEDAVSAGTYHIVQRFLPLDKRAFYIGRDFVHMRRRYPMTLVTLEELDRLSPSRQRVGFGPDTVAEGPELVDGTKTVEAYPYSTDGESLRYIYWETVLSLKLADTLPPRVPAYALKEGALIDLYRYNMGDAAKNGRGELAAFWRNEMRAQESKWEQYIREAILADRGVDDQTFILRSANTPIRAFDIQTAHDEVYARWPR